MFRTSARIILPRLLTAAVVLLIAVPTHAVGTVQQQCQATKNKVAGQYAACRQSAEAKLATTGDATRYAAAITRCTTKFTSAWQRAIDKATAGGATCLDSPLTATDFQTAIDNHDDNVASALGGGGLAAGTTCGNGTAEADEHCDGSDLNGTTCSSLGFAGGTLACDGSCVFDLSACVAGGSPGGLPVTGQTTSYGPGDNGDIQSGAPLSYADNGDGTIIDLNTGLLWEKKVELGNGNTLCSTEAMATCGDPHNATNRYSWNVQGNISYDGTVVTIFLAQLNDRCDRDTMLPCAVDADCSVPGGPCGFTGHRDWRLPNRKELESLFDAGAIGPAIHPTFHHASCGPACSNIADPACSCTTSGAYWTSTTFFTPLYAWTVHFYLGLTEPSDKTIFALARAVRGGS